MDICNRLRLHTLENAHILMCFGLASENANFRKRSLGWRQFKTEPHRIGVNRENGGF